MQELVYSSPVDSDIKSAINCDMLTITLLFVLLGAAVLCWFLLKSYRIVSTRSHVSQRKKKEDWCALFTAYGELAEYAYSDPVVGNNVEKKTSQYSFTLVESFDGGRFWLWKATETHPNSHKSCSRFHVLVIRGSYIMSEWIKDDVSLVKAALGNEYAFHKLVEDCFARVEKRLSMHNDITSLVYVGHSLGASLAEALLALKCRKEEKSDLYTAVTFDSPGQPNNFREKHMTVPMPRVYALNSVINTVNTLMSPCAERFFSCGIGSRITPSHLFHLLSDLCRVSFSQVLNVAVGQHPMNVILTYLRTGSIVEESPESWPVISGISLRLASQLYSNIRNSLSELSTFMRDNKFDDPPYQPPQIDKAVPIPIKTDKVVPLVAGTNERKKESIPSLPDKMEEFVPRSIYRITVDGDPTYVEWNRFLTMLDRNRDILVPFFGTTGAGKSTTMNKLLRLPEEMQIHTGGGVNNSVNVYVALYHSNDTIRVFLLDFPGFGASEAFAGVNKFITDSAESLVSRANGMIACTALVCHDTIQYQKKIFLDIKSKQMKLLVCHNNRLKKREHIEEREEHYRRELNISKDSSEGTVVTYSPYDEGDYNITQLEEELMKFLSDHGDDILLNVRKAQLAQEHERVQRCVSDALNNSFLHRAIAHPSVLLATSSISAWAVGVPTWVAVCGTVGASVTLPAIGTLAAVPAASVLGVTAIYTGVRAFRRKTLVKKARNTVETELKCTQNIQNPKLSIDQRFHYEEHGYVVISQARPVEPVEFIRSFTGDNPRMLNNALDTSKLTLMHQDQHYMNLSPVDRCVTCWSCSHNRGLFRILPGSHTILRIHKDGVVQLPQKFQQLDKRIELLAGDLLFVHPLLVYEGAEQCSSAMYASQNAVAYD